MPEQSIKTQLQNAVLTQLHHSERFPIDKETMYFIIQIQLNVDCDSCLDELRKKGISLHLLERHTKMYDISLDAQAKIFVMFLYDNLIRIQMFCIYLHWYRLYHAPTAALSGNEPIGLDWLNKYVFKDGLISVAELDNAYREMSLTK